MENGAISPKLKPQVGKGAALAAPHNCGTKEKRYGFMPYQTELYSWIGLCVGGGGKESTKAFHGRRWLLWIVLSIQCPIAFAGINTHSPPPAKSSDKQLVIRGISFGRKSARAKPWLQSKEKTNRGKVCEISDGRKRAYAEGTGNQKWWARGPNQPDSEMWKRAANRAGHQSIGYWLT